MDRLELTGLSLDLPGLSAGAPQESGPMAVVPLFGPEAAGEFAPPLSGLKLSAIRGYGNMELEHAGGPGVAIVPLHMGYIQDQAQNHALCRSAFLGAGQKVTFRDACCVQQAQGGYLTERQQWFFVLPLQLRREALSLRGTEGFGKLWTAIAKLSATFGFTARGHLEQIVSRRRPYLTQYLSRFELLPGQIGALFFLRGRLAGVEIAPTAAYFAEVWGPLVAFCYGTAAMYEETRRTTADAEPPLDGADLAGLRRSLAAERAALAERLREAVERAPAADFAVAEEERYLSLRLLTVENGAFAGQTVRDGDRLVYASIAAAPEYLDLN
jgi:hypothetical protein